MVIMMGDWLTKHGNQKRVGSFPKNQERRILEMKRFAFVRAVVLVSLVGIVEISQAADPAMQSIIMQLRLIQEKLDALQNQVQPRKYFLTKDEYQGDQVLNACSAVASGYHMASIWEILDPSNLQYDYQNGYTKADSGFGPPTGVFGWIRTGSDFDVDVDPYRAGLANCGGWTTTTQLARGTVASLHDRWIRIPVFGDLFLDTQKFELFDNAFPWWDTGAALCYTDHAVWCVSDN